MAQCTLCEHSNTYFGQTMTPLHIRMNGHWAKFIADENNSFEESALSFNVSLRCYHCTVIIALLSNP